MVRRRVSRAALVGMLVVACAAGGSLLDLRVRQNGPLELVDALGSLSMYAPDSTPWRGIHGAFILCSKDGQPVYLDSVAVSFKVPPHRPPRVVVHADNQDPGGVGSQLGSFEELRSQPGFTGEHRPVQGIEVIDLCSDDPGPPEHELLIEIESSGEGAWVQGITVLYHDAHHHRFRLWAPTTRIVCGSAIEPDEYGNDWCDQS